MKGVIVNRTASPRPTRARAVLLAAVLLALALSASAAAAPAAAGGHRPDTYVLPDDARYPEGITVAPASAELYISSVADGSIYRGELDTGRLEPYLPAGSDGRTQAVGLKATRDHLYVAGGTTGSVFIYDRLDGTLAGSFHNALAEGTFLNDLAVTRHGDVFVTDSYAPILWRLPARALEASASTGVGELEAWLDLTGTAVAYGEGFNLNGIVATPDGSALLVVQSNTGRLYRVDIATRHVSEVDLNGDLLTNGDGLVLRGRTLYVVRNADAVIAKVRLNRALSAGRVRSSTTDASFAFPTTAALARGRLLVVNSQFDRGGPAGPGQPDVPFTISSIERP